MSVSITSAPRPALDHEVFGHLQAVHRRLSLCLDTVEEIAPHLEDSRLRACLAILGEDLTSLLEECEELLVGATAPIRQELLSLDARVSCVLEEVLGLMRQISESP